MAVKDTRNLGALRSHVDDFETIPSFLPAKSANELFIHLMKTIDWKPEVVKMFGKTIETRRQVAFFGMESQCYVYSGTRHQARPMPASLIEVLKRVQDHCDEPFNTILATRYLDGKTGLGWHRDDEGELGPLGQIQIASLSLGVTRQFEIRHHLTQNIHRFDLESGTLALMAKGFQERWQHRVPVASKITEPRISLSFRTLTKQDAP